MQTINVNGSYVSVADFQQMHGLHVDRTLYLSGCTALTALPDGLSVGRSLNLSGCTALTNIFQAGADARGYRFCGVRLANGWRVIAGCRNFSPAEARERWAEGTECRALAERVIAAGTEPHFNTVSNERTTEMNLTYAPHRLSIAGHVKEWRVVKRNSMIMDVYAQENDARHVCGLPPVPDGDKAWPDRLVFGPSGGDNPINRVEPAEGQSRVGGAAAMLDTLSGGGITRADERLHWGVGLGAPPSAAQLRSADAEDAASLMRRHGLGLALLSSDAAPLLGYRVTGLPEGHGALLIQDGAGWWHILPSPFEHPLPAAPVFRDACRMLLDYLENAQIRSTDASGVSDAPAVPEKRETPPTGENPGFPTALDRVAAALERLAAAFGSLDPKDMSHLEWIARTTEALVQRRR